MATTPAERQKLYRQTIKSDPVRYAAYLKYKRRANRAWSRTKRERLRRESPDLWALYLEHHRVSETRRRRANPQWDLWRKAKQRAERFGLPFTITVEDIVVPKICPVLGLRLTVGSGRLTNASPTLDRIKPKRGYVAGNIAVISHRANRIKSDANVAELTRVAAWLSSVIEVKTA